MQDEHKSWSDSEEEKMGEGSSRQIHLNFSLTCTAVAFKGMLHAKIINPIFSPSLLSNTFNPHPLPLSDYPLPFSG